MAAEAAAQPAGERHRDHRSGGDAEQRESQGARRGAGLLLDGRDADDPAREDEAVEGEEGGDGDTQAGEVVGAPHGTVRPGFVH
jgi:hypothetical protein